MGKGIGGRILGLIPAILLQALIFVLLFTVLKPAAPYIHFVLEVIAIIAIIFIISEQDVSSYKQIWMLVILVIPIFGILMYIFFGNKKTGSRLRKKIERSRVELNWQFPDSYRVENISPGPLMLRAAETVSNVMSMTDMPVYCCGDTRFYSVGDECVEDLLNDLKKAEKYIYMEYFILEYGKFFGSITDILSKKVKEGVDVRIMYDDLGSITTFSKKNFRQLESIGIKVVRFNPLKYITPRVNNRDHRKMTIIDGKTAYSGGINIADEYINEIERFGHWKDLVFRIEGDAVINYTFMFAEFWNAFSDDKIESSSLPSICLDTGVNGYVLSYYENPVGQYHTSNLLYIDLLSQATDYIWFYTPYLMLDDSLMNMFINTARRGVDVRIIMPGIPDKPIIYRISRSYYGPLMKAGVRIFEYTPGFVHAKACICDGRVASIGTVNLDFRSLFLHFENNSVFYGSTIVDDLKKDMDEQFGICRERKCNDGLPGTHFGVIQALLRIIAPLL